MRLMTVFSEAIQHSDRLVKLHESLTTTNQRKIRKDWADHFYGAKLVPWPRKNGLWRSRAGEMLIVGTSRAQLSYADFTSEALNVLLRGALVFAMAAVDKLLHEAVAKKFVSLVKKRKLDDLLKLELSTSYRIAIESRVRSGKGGKVRKRPAAKLRAAVFDRLYRETFLAADKLQRIVGACGLQNVYGTYGQTLTPRLREETFRKRWMHLYTRRNAIAHECDVVRQSKARRVRFHAVTAAELRDNIATARAFGTYLARELDS